MLTKEDLQSIELIVTRAIGGVEGEVSSLNTKVTSLDSKVSSLESSVSTLQTDVATLKADVSDLKTDVSSLNSRVSNLEQDMRVVKVDLLENKVIPRLDTIEKCYVDTSKRYMEKTDEFDAAIVDIEVMKLAIQKNSRDIEELKKKQA